MAFACDLPGVVIFDASAAQRLQAPDIANGGRVWRCVEIAGDDAGKRPAVTRIEIRQRDDLAFAGPLPRQAATTSWPR
jgi:hypothetical protein